MTSAFDILREARADRLSRGDKLRLLSTMLLIRRFEEALSDQMVERDAADKAAPRSFEERRRIRTPCHLYIGQEAVAAGVCAALRRDDWIWSTHRAHGHYLAKGGDVDSALAEIYCRATGCVGGRGGSMHLCAPEEGMAGSTAIVGGNVPLGVGAATAEFVRGSDRISVIFFGDAAMDEGVFWEVLNWAVLHGLPAVFVCENNLYSTHLHLKYRRKNQDLMALVRPYGLPVVDADGNDVLEVLATAGEAVDRARRGEGPTFLHYRTYRWRGHVGPYDNLEVGLRSPDEIEAWIRRCPIQRLQTRLESEGLFAEEEWDAIQRSVDGRMRAAIEAAWAAPRPPSNTVGEHVFRSREES